MDAKREGDLCCGVVATRHDAAAEAGAAMLRGGGNAVDAAVACAFALGVVVPSSTGVAGYGGCAVVHVAGGGGASVIDFNCRAPEAARPDMFNVRPDPDGALTVAGGRNAVGGSSVAVPGVVAGLGRLLDRFGTVPLATALAPAIDAAAEGFVVDRATSQRIKRDLLPRAGDRPDTIRLFTLNGRAPEPGERLSNPELAATLRDIGRGGAQVFYQSPLADAVVAAVRRDGGVLARTDLASYAPTEETASQAAYRDFACCASGLGTGGLTVLQMARVLEQLDAPDLEDDDASLIHTMVEVEKVCWRQRLLRYGDPEVVPIDPAEELADSTIQRLRGEAASGLASPQPGVVVAPDPLGGTANVCSVDRRGNVVALTLTHGGSFGSLLAVPGTGLVLGHGMSRFDPRPGLPNSIAPRKRPLQNMAPLVVLRAGRPVLAIGAAGGRTIQGNILHALVRVLDRREPPARALAATRVHVESAEPVEVETGGDALADGLRRRGHDVRMREPFGSMQIVAISRPSGAVTGAADPRDDGAVAIV